MPTQYPKQPGESVPDAIPGSVVTFADPTGKLGTRDESGTVKPSVEPDGSPILLEERDAGPGPGVKQGGLYAKDVSGVTELFYQDSSGNGNKEAQVTEDGVVKAPAPTPSTFFEPTQAADLAVFVESGIPVALNTGLVFPILGDNQTTQAALRFEATTNQAGGPALDMGLATVVVAWNTAPTLPDPGLISRFIGSGGDANFEFWGSVVTGLSLNASGEMVIDLGHNLGGVEWAGTLRVMLGPGKLMSFDPMPPPPPP